MEYRNDPPPLPPQEQQEYDIPPLKPGNWLWQSILATLFCCMPFGVVGIIYAAKVDSLYFNGKYEESGRMARKAKMWTLVSLGAALLYWIFWIIMFVTGNLPEYMENIIENNASGYNF
ncbi:CD225/dispanin family protein [Proteiniphilum sp. X52]|uniref:CD225/dispanin family protein n=1 Tax=Proteiniphilum sp. X52 TaxID=2382159 RepID=UPI000F0A1C4B|nr:CD225/dispanin family protein [Proteiniphilum sp. X52]RNC64307.1 CD225/dispanin family protein [Proteiniphilum sp. X52]